MGGWSGKSKEGEERTWKPNGEAVWATINYAVSTGRLESRKEEAEVRPTQGPDDPEASELSVTNDGA